MKRRILLMGLAFGLVVLVISATTAQAGLLVGAEQSICPPLQVPAMPRQPAPVGPWGMNQQSCGPTWTWPFTCLTCTA